MTHKRDHNDQVSAMAPDSITPACSRWQEAFALAQPSEMVMYPLTRADLDFEHNCLQALFLRIAARPVERAAREQARRALAEQRAREWARQEAQAARQAAEQAAHEAAEQAQYDAQYQARQEQARARRVAEAKLEREARKDDGWLHRHRVAKTDTSTAKQKAARDCGYVHETFALAGSLRCFEFERSDLDLLGDLEIPLPGLNASAHARRRAFLARASLTSSRPISLARKFAQTGAQTARRRAA